MAFLKIFKSHKNQRYDYKPRFWNPDEEERKERLKRLNKIKEDESDLEQIKSRISTGLRRGYKHDQKYRSKQMYRSNVRLVIIIVFLAALTYILINVYLPKIVTLVQ